MIINFLSYDPETFWTLGAVAPLGVNFRPCVVHHVQQILGVHREHVAGGQHAPLVILVKSGSGVFLGHFHGLYERGHVRAEDLMSHFNLTVRFWG